MGTKLTSFEEALAFGQEGEHEVAKELIRYGVAVMPLYQFETEHAPFILTRSEKVVSPDLLCFGSVAFMVEVKTKNQWVRYKGVAETGIDQRLYDHYKRVQEATKINVWLYYNHKKEEPTGIFFCLLDDYTRKWDGCVNGKRVHKPMVFYDIKKLRRLV